MIGRYWKINFTYIVSVHSIYASKYKIIPFRKIHFSAIKTVVLTSFF